MCKKIQWTMMMLVVAALLLSACAPLQTAQPASAGSGESKPAAALSGEPSPVEAVPPAGAEEVARRVVEWNVDYVKGELSTARPQNPFVNGAYQETGLFTAHFAARVDRILDIPEEWGDPNYDPILTGFGTEFEFAYEVLPAQDGTAAVIVHETLADFQRDITLKLVQEDQAWKVDDILEASLATPEGVTQLFYDEYLWYAKREGNPYQDGVYRTSPYLSPAFIDQVDYRQAQPQAEEIDPLVMASDYPPGVQILAEKTEREGEQARVIVRRFTSGLEPDPLVVTLESTGKTWQIVDIGVQAGPQKPGDAVQEFYTWYLDYIGDPAVETFRNPLVDRAYREAPNLAPELVQQIDSLLESSAGFGYDPFLCAQDVPLAVTPSGTFLMYEFTGPQVKNSARVAVRTSFPGHWFTVDLKQDEPDTPWQISAVTCGNSVEGKVYAFFTWHMGCDETGFSCRQPAGGNQALSEGWITADFARRIEALQASFREHEASGYDPLLIAQAFPSGFSTQLVFQDEAQALVLLHTEWGTQVQDRLVQLVPDGGWKINNVRLANPNTPAAVTETFFAWYLEYLQQADRREVGYNFQPEEYLSPALLSELGNPLAAPEGGQNALLLSSELPEKLEFGPVDVDGEAARVEVQRFGPGFQELPPLSVELEQVHGLWLIRKIR